MTKICSFLSRVFPLTNNNMTDTANQQCTDQTAIVLSVVKRAIKQFSKVPLVFDRSYFLVYLFQQGFDGNIVSLHLFDCFVSHNLFIPGGHTSSVRKFIPFLVSPRASFAGPATVQSSHESLYFMSIRINRNIHVNLQSFQAFLIAQTLF